MGPCFIHGEYLNFENIAKFYPSLYYGQHPLWLTIDTGATLTMVHALVARHIVLPISLASQMTRQADGVPPMEVTGEVHGDLTRGNKSFQLNALVVDALDVDLLAGQPFLLRNDCATG